jgi:hypothetical protein
MSRKRRKTIGAAKIRRNRLVRVMRGARKAGAPMPGDGAAFRAPDGWLIDARLEAHGKALRAEVAELHRVTGGRGE